MKKTSKSPIVLAILCAVGVHTVIFTDAGHRMQGAITESASTVNVSDSSLVLNEDTISLVVQKDISQATKINASLNYNGEAIALSQPKSSLGNIIIKNEDYSENISVTLAWPTDIAKGTVMATWKMTILVPEIHTINLSDVQIDSTTWIIKLSTKGTGEF